MMEMEIKLLQPEDVKSFAALIHLFAEVFELKDWVCPEEAYLKSLLEKPNFLVFTAQTAQGVIGGLTVFVLHSYYVPRPVAYIYDVGVMPAYQGQGVGKALIQQVLEYCRARNYESAYVEAEADDQLAIDFYRKTPFDLEMGATHFTYLF